MRRVFRGGLAVVCLACAPTVQPLKGVPTPVRGLPAMELPPGHRKIVFQWEYTEGEQLTRGEGAVRMAPPDSARLDFFLGSLGGAAVLIGDSLRANGGAMVRRFIPPVPFMWAALGRLVLPALPDSSETQAGLITEYQIGRPPQWRIIWGTDSSMRLQHVRDSRLLEQLSRARNGSVVYEAPSAHRKLRLTILRTEQTDPFDASIWNP